MSILLALTGVGLPTSFGSYPSSMNSVKWAFSFTSSLASGSIPSGDSVLIEFAGAGGCYLNRSGATTQIQWGNDTFSYFSAQTVTFSASQTVTVTLDIPNGNVIIAGATTGNGTFAVFNSISFGVAPVYAGQTSGGGNLFSGSMTDVVDFGGSTVAMTGTGALSATLRAQANFTAAPTGTGALSATLRATANFTAAPTGTGTLSATLRATASLTAALAGTGTLTAAAGAAAAMSGTGTFTAVGRSTANASMAASGTGALSAAGSAIASFVASLSGAGALSATLRAAAALTAALSGTGTLSAALASIGMGASAMSGTGTLTAAGQGLLILTIPTSAGIVPPFRRTADPQRTVLIADTTATPDNGHFVGIPGLTSPEFSG